MIWTLAELILIVVFCFALYMAIQPLRSMLERRMYQWAKKRMGNSAPRGGKIIDVTQFTSARDAHFRNKMNQDKTDSPGKSGEKPAGEKPDET